MFLSNDILDEFLWNEKDKLKGEFVKINENQSNKSINKYEEYFDWEQNFVNILIGNVHFVSENEIFLNVWLRSIYRIAKIFSKIMYIM